MGKPGQMRGTAITLGVTALILIGVGVGIAVFADDGPGSVSSGVLIRTGAILGATALVLPRVKKPSASTLAVAGAGLALVLFRPALIWVALGVWIVWQVLNRQRKTADNES